MKLPIDEKFLTSLSKKELIGIIKVVKYNYLSLQLELNESNTFYEKKIKSLTKEM